MKSDEGFLNNVDKQILIKLVNENVRLISFLKYSKTPIAVMLLGVFLCLILLKY